MKWQHVWFASQPSTKRFTPLNINACNGNPPPKMTETVAPSFLFHATVAAIKSWSRGVKDPNAASVRACVKSSRLDDDNNAGEGEEFD